jgi:hypothetical protein
MWRGQTQWRCGGRVFTGPNFWKFALTFTGICITNLLSLALNWVAYIERQKNPAPLLIGLFLFTMNVFFLLKTSLTDPGFIPFQQED